MPQMSDTGSIGTQIVSGQRQRSDRERPDDTKRQFLQHSGRSGATAPPHRRCSSGTRSAGCTISIPSGSPTRYRTGRCRLCRRRDRGRLNPSASRPIRSEPENVSLSGEDAADMAPAARPWAGPRSDVEARLVRCGARRRGSGCAARTRNDCRAGMNGRLVTAQAHTKRQVQAMLWARAYHKAITLTFSRPRTTNCFKPRLRAWALAHSAVAARSL